jgi:periodic tryptophan protein 2
LWRPWFGSSLCHGEHILPRSLHGYSSFRFSQLNSKNLGDGGPIDEEADSGDETTYNALSLPGARRGDDGSRKSRVEVLTRQVSFSPTGREWAVVTGEGLHIYSLDEDLIFDPISLTEAITPAAVEAKLAATEYGLALRMAIHLNEFALIKNVMECTPYHAITAVVRTVGPEQLERLLQVVGKVLEDSPHIEFYLQWSLELLQTHGKYMDRNRASFMRAFRALHKAVSTKYADLNAICNENKYTLDFIEDHAALLMSQSRC